MTAEPALTPNPSNLERVVSPADSEMPDFVPEEALAILKRFEPEIRYTRGEQFFPVDVEWYVSQCSLWIKRPEKPPELLTSQEDMSLDQLIKPHPAEFGSVVYLKFIEPLDVIELAKYSLSRAASSLTRKKDRDTFHPGKGRLARVGFGSRFVDALFSLTLIWRGRVPGDAAAAAALTYQKRQTASPSYTYYGRVIREGQWIVLQYWYLYPFNNWRSGFFGVNDHEADWEMISIYCFDPAANKAKDATTDPALVERLTPGWVAYASHDFSGDDLRRRWDDPEVEKKGEHPIVYAGAGSHASYFSQGEYLTEIELPFLAPLVRLVESFQNVWGAALRQGGAKSQKPDFNVFRIPFVDYGRGDGIHIGPSSQRKWEACILDDLTPWASGYRGLWGLYAQDPIAGENAPAGPVYNRDGSPRRSWYDPLGWAGMDKTPAPNQIVPILENQKEWARLQEANLNQQIAERGQELVQLGIEAAALYNQPHLERAHAELLKRTHVLSTEISELKKQKAVMTARIEAFEQYEQKIVSGDAGPPRSHIRHAHTPSTQPELRMGIIAEALSAISVGLLMVAVVLLILLARKYTLYGIAALVGVIIFLEASFRRRLPYLINNLTISLAILSGLVLMYEFFWQIVVIGVLAAGLFIIWENIKELGR